MPQSRRLRPTRVKCIARQKCRLKIAAVAATAADADSQTRDFGYNRLKIAAVAATAAGGEFVERHSQMRPPQDCRSRGDCGSPWTCLTCRIKRRLKIAAVAATAAASWLLGWLSVISASRLPQSRRLRPHLALPDSMRGVPASRLPQSRRLRLLQTRADFGIEDPPQDCRSRGDCGQRSGLQCRSTNSPPQDCRSRGDCGPNCLGIASPSPLPPQDCRSRGDCGSPRSSKTSNQTVRLKIAAVAATAAANVHCH